jgi:predicted DsbA family dithiol-disulfide isomerase
MAFDRASSEVNPRPPTVVEVFADVACPFAHVGLRRLVDRRRELGREDVRLWVRAWPLELVNGIALESGSVTHKVRELRAQVAPDLFTAFDPEHFPATSMPAFRLSSHAYRQGLDAGERMSLALRDALFEDGRDISKEDVLADLAQRVGVSAAESTDLDRVTADWHDGEERNVIGSPHFFVGDTSWFCPALEISQAEGGLRIAPDTVGFDRFARACFERLTPGQLTD